MDLPIIDCHTHIGRLPGVVGDLYTPEDLCYICAHEGVRFMLVSSASATTVGQWIATQETIDMVEAPRQPKPPASETAATRAE